MSLTECSKCKEQIAEEAHFCPKCGCTTNKYQEDVQLREKIASKITVSTVMAGFNFTVLMLMLDRLSENKGGDGTSSVNTFLLETAITFFFVSTALFVAAIYSYDQLLMPRCFWVEKYKDSKRHEKLSNFIEKMGYKRGNRVYVYMISSWFAMFIPATLCSTLGILLILLALLECKFVIVILGSMILVFISYFFLKPKLGPD